MMKKWIYPLAAFLTAFLFHSLYFVWKVWRLSAQWSQSETTAILPYFKQQEYFLSFSYALTAAFTVYALLKFLRNRQRGLAGLLGGLTLTGGLYAGGCLLLGCCGSPLLAVYLGFFGSSFLAFGKPLTALVTTLSVLAGYYWLEKKGKKCCGNAADCMETRETRGAENTKE